ncbi:MAG: hypothetical protein Kow00127_21050 [Bacteroidales bacterium]
MTFETMSDEMEKQMEMPSGLKHLFEVSWEVCNKVGGIHTVITSKYAAIREKQNHQQIFIGPDVLKETESHSEFIEDPELFKEWKLRAREDEIFFRTGRWDIPGQPIAILVDFTTFFPLKDKIFAHFWEKFQLDSITGNWDYIEPALFGYATGKVIESFCEIFGFESNSVIAHYHEWMTGAGVLYLKAFAPWVTTVFTTHATVLGRSMAGREMQVYQVNQPVNADEMARNLGVAAKASLEKCAAREADIFTTVSTITASECERFLGRKPDVVTPNGFTPELIPGSDNPSKVRSEVRNRLNAITRAVTGSRPDENALYLLTSGRYEFGNKGIDLYISALNEYQNNPAFTRPLVACIAVPAHHAGPDRVVVNRMESEEEFTGEPGYLTHNLHNPESDPVINALKKYNITNKPGSKVTVIFIPVYLDGHDGVVNLPYYRFLTGFDLTVFASWYEPWGYTPLESIAAGIPTVTTSLSGFGNWIQEKSEPRHHAVTILNRTDFHQPGVVTELAAAIGLYAGMDETERNHCQEECLQIAGSLHWKVLYKYYIQAYRMAAEIKKDHFPRIVTPVRIFYETRVTGFRELPEWHKMFIRSYLPDEILPLREISMNLWWSWNHDALELFESIDKNLWEETGHNPVALLNRAGHQRLKEVSEDQAFLAAMERVYSRFQSYMDETPAQDQPHIAYFSMEYGLHESIRIYSGGLGILAGDYLKEASDQGKRLTALGLLYRYGYFNQSISVFGDQVSANEPQKYTDLPLHPVRDAGDEWIKIGIALPGRTMWAKAWVLKVGHVDLYLLDTDLPENQEMDRGVTHHLYGGDWDNRFKQELLLGVGGIRLLNKLGIHPDIYHLNEGHAAFAGLERLRLLVEGEGKSYPQAKELVRANGLFTTHTPVPAGHDTFSEDMLRTYIPHYAHRLNLSWDDFMALGRMNPANPGEKFSMSVLAMNLCAAVNGVSKIHGRVSRDMFRSLYPGFFSHELHITHVTNGVHYDTWTSPVWKKFYSQKLSAGLNRNSTDRDAWNKIEKIPADVIWKHRVKQRKIFLEYLRKKVTDDLKSRQESPVVLQKAIEGIREDALYIGFARRFATYKRAHLLFTDKEELQKILSDPDRPVRIIFAGKAHPNDQPGKDLIKMIVSVARSPEFAGKIFFLENYDMDVARHLVSGVDVWLNTPTRPMEASGTSGEKAVLNGVLNLSVLDGWWAEGYTPGGGWAIPEAKTYANQQYQDELDALTIYRMIKEEVAPAFFELNNSGIPASWVKMIKTNLKEIAPGFTMKRMVDDYWMSLYMPLHERSLKLWSNENAPALELAAWKQKVASQWNNMKVVSVTTPDFTIRPLTVRETFEVEIVLDIASIDPNHLIVELLLARKEMDQIDGIIASFELKPEEFQENKAVYRAVIEPPGTGVYDFAFRITPWHPLMPHRQDFPLVKWI